MKINTLIVALVAVLGFIITPVATLHAADTTTPAATKAAKTAKTPYKGNLTAIDTAANTITVANGSQTLTLAIASTTTFKKDKKAATLADFAVGDKVTGSYTKDDAGKLTAASVHSKSAKGAIAAPAAQ